MAKNTPLSRISASSRALLRRAHRGSQRAAQTGAQSISGADALRALRDDLKRLSDTDIQALWDELNAAKTRTEPNADEVIYRAIDKSRRKLVVTVDRFLPLLLTKVVELGGVEAPSTPARSLKALVKAFCDAGRGEEIAAAAQALVRERSFAYDIT